MTRSATPPQREAIIAAATRLFGERGYPATTMRDLASAVGILPGSLYAHISSKDAVLLEIVEGGVDRFNGAAGHVDQQDLPPDAALRAIVGEHLRIVGEDPARTLVVFHQWRHLEEPHRARLLAERRRYEAFFLRLVDEGIERGVFSPMVDARVAVLGVLGALNWTPEWFSPAGPETPQEVADKLADALLGGLLHRR